MLKCNVFLQCSADLTVKKFGVCMIVFFFNEINTFINQGCIKLIKNVSEDISTVIKYLYFK